MGACCLLYLWSVNWILLEKGVMSLASVFLNRILSLHGQIYTWFDRARSFFVPVVVEWTGFKVTRSAWSVQSATSKSSSPPETVLHGSVMKFVWILICIWGRTAKKPSFLGRCGAIYQLKMLHEHQFVLRSLFRGSVRNIRGNCQGCVFNCLVCWIKMKNKRAVVECDRSYTVSFHRFPCWRPRRSQFRQTCLPDSSLPTNWAGHWCKHCHIQEAVVPRWRDNLFKSFVFCIHVGQRSKLFAEKLFFIVHSWKHRTMHLQPLMRPKSGMRTELSTNYLLQENDPNVRCAFMILR